MKTYRCSKCDELKTANEFHKDAGNRSRDELNYWCKICMLDYQHQKTQQYRKEVQDELKPAIPNFYFEDGFALTGVDMGKAGAKLTLSHQQGEQDEGGAILLPPKEINRLTEWLTNLICSEGKVVIPNEIRENRSDRVEGAAVARDRLWEQTTAPVLKTE